MALSENMQIQSETFVLIWFLIAFHGDLQGLKQGRKDAAAKKSHHK